MAEKTYAVTNGAAPGAAPAVPITTGTATKTMIQLATNTSTPAIRFVEWWVEFDGSTAKPTTRPEVKAGPIDRRRSPLNVGVDMGSRGVGDASGVGVALGLAVGLATGEADGVGDGDGC